MTISHFVEAVFLSPVSLSGILLIDIVLYFRAHLDFYLWKMLWEKIKIIRGKMKMKGGVKTTAGFQHSLQLEIPLGAPELSQNLITWQGKKKASNNKNKRKSKHPVYDVFLYFMCRSKRQSFWMCTGYRVYDLLCPTHFCWIAPVGRIKPT